MKNAIFFVLAICISVASKAQDAFTTVSLKNIHNRETLVFGTAHEVNVRHYRIEACNDGLNFETIATIPAKTNSVRAQQYSYDLAAYNYVYYRVAKVEMDGNMPYSAIVWKKTVKENGQPDIQAMSPGSMLANK